MAKGEVQSPLIRTRAIVKTYGKKLREGRERAELSQREAAERLGVSQATLSRFESGETQPDFPTLHKMREAYGCKISELMPRNQYPGAPLDPLKRRIYFIRRNAYIQGADPDKMQAQIMGDWEKRMREQE